MFYLLQRGTLAEVKDWGGAAAWFDTGTHGTCSRGRVRFAPLNRPGLKSACTEEVAYHMGYKWAARQVTFRGRAFGQNDTGGILASSWRKAARPRDRGRETGRWRLRLCLHEPVRERCPAPAPRWTGHRITFVGRPQRPGADPDRSADRGPRHRIATARSSSPRA